MKLLTFLILFMLIFAQACNEKTPKVQDQGLVQESAQESGEDTIQGHDVEHAHVSEGEMDHPHNEGHHEEHDHKAHHPDHQD